MRLYKNGIQQIVTVDDYFPCEARSGQPIFSRAVGNELWVMLLEKAYAKLHGNYWALTGGLPHEALIDLTGKPTEHCDLKEVAKDSAFFDKMLIANQRGYLLCGETEGDIILNNNGKSETGILPGYVYLIREVKKSKEGNRLLEIRNPWGKGECKREDQFEPSKANYALFWMSYEDFCKHFSAVSICKNTD